ncbi:osmoprotectant transport system ATP-binding protein [Kineosphaera limosa]|uniref:ABC-type quaternary amine transporter n=1 Tax=Kineosphaera limosa NBRC 100340 TaxID=1184609 RepID=K6WPP7_9MICO|nr:ATP-binding cassette domain-containing protein [Kineosphaera limosa]NYE02247.1 osmoprotectant transport system ATP-binding protein [Kineosphaera limosa]GAB94102.1 putative ABC transporter ATP-binding protein [Kineosphaera limosa NBRC 100340]
MITFEAVTKRFDDGTVAVDDLSLVVPTGRITVFVGPSGCGKTTTLRMINRMIEPTSGRILIDDEDTASMDAAQLRRNIGYVIQHAGLFPHRTVLDNIATVPRLLGTKRGPAREQALTLMERVGLATGLANRYPAQLSGGQQQRVGVARALAADPPIMLMDEPFSAVDPIVREQLQAEFLRLQDELGKTIVFVTHDIDEAVTLGDQVAVFAVGGVLAQMDTPVALLDNPTDDFVADFVGRDRGFRALGFTSAHVSPGRAPTVHLGEVARADAPWVVVLDGDRPVGWVEPHRLDGPVTAPVVHRGGTIARVDGSLRGQLDAALSSPTLQGLLVDEEGRYAGVVEADRVLAAIEAANRGSQAQDEARNEAP